MKKKETEKEQEAPRLVVEQTEAPEKADARARHAEASDVGEKPTLKEIIQEQAKEDETPHSNTFTLRKILGGDILSTSTIRRQVWVFMLITLFVIIYISNRYSCQQDLIEIDRLQKELLHAKYKALSSSSQLTEKCRESHVLNQLQNNKDSLLKIANQPPYIINIPEE